MRLKSQKGIVYLDIFKLLSKIIKIWFYSKGYTKANRSQISANDDGFIIKIIFDLRSNVEMQLLLMRKILIEV